MAEFNRCGNEGGDGQEKDEEVIDEDDNEGEEDWEDIDDDDGDDDEGNNSVLRGAIARGLDTQYIHADTSANTPFILKVATEITPMMTVRGVLIIATRGTMKPGTKQKIGQSYLDEGKLELESQSGYIEHVEVWDNIQLNCPIFTSRVHRDAIRLLCGDESVTLLEEKRAICGSAWLMTGGDARNEGQYVLLKPLLHKIESAIGDLPGNTKKFVNMTCSYPGCSLRKFLPCRCGICKTTFCYTHIGLPHNCNGSSPADGGKVDKGEVEKL